MSFYFFIEIIHNDIIKVGLLAYVLKTPKYISQENGAGQTIIICLWKQTPLKYNHNNNKVYTSLRTSMS